MKKLTTPVGKFGPYTSIVELEDRYECDNSHLPFTVIGKGEISDVQDGDFPVPPPPPPPVPQSVTMRQARLAMLGAGILSGVEAAIAAMLGDEGKAAQIEWEYATEVRRDWPLVQNLIPALGMTSEQVDALFVQAATL